MDHPDRCDLEGGSRNRIAFEVDTGSAPADVAQILVAQTLGKNLGNVAVGHQQIPTDDKAGAAVRDVGRPQQLDPADGWQSRFDPLLDRRIGGQAGPQRMSRRWRSVEIGGAETAVLDIIHRPQRRNDDRLDVVDLIGGDLSAQRQRFHSGSCRFEQFFSGRGAAGPPDRK